jgi:pSer/pThr/pTyr-binding forkhead associated (FHA) protein
MKRTGSESPADRFMIGRTKDNDISMKDMAISKKHAAISISNGSFLIQDLGSTNGTKINGRPVNKKPEKLHDQAIIRLGNHAFTFLTPDSLHDLLSKS